MRSTALALIASALLGGCALTASSHHPVRPSAVARANATHEYRTPTAPPDAAAAVRSAAGASPTATQALRNFATAYINWDAATVAADMQDLAAQSIGQARSAVLLAAAQTAQDYELQRGGIANSGTVEAIAPLPGRAGQYVVVTRERTTATNTTAYQGLAAAWHVAVASVTRLASGGWVVSGWQPEN